MMRLCPLRLRPDQLTLGAILAAAFASLPYIVAPQRFSAIASIDDFANYWSAGATVGTHLLVNVRDHVRWQIAHQLAPQPFVYPPAFAWLYAPLSHLAPRSALWVEEIAMTAIFALCAWLIARIYAFPLWFALLAVFAWGPTIASIEDGQNTGLALFLILVAAVGLLDRKPVLTGIATGALLCKPTDAAALVLLLAARRELRALAIAGACGAVWYVLSIAASGGDALWPMRYVQTVHDWYLVHSAGNRYGVLTLPTQLLALGAPMGLAVASSAALLIAALPLFARRPTLEAVSMAPLIGLAASLHAWHYTAALLLPVLCYAMSRLVEPWRTRVVVAAYAIGAFAVSIPYTGPSLFTLCVGGALWWLLRGYFGVQRVAAWARHS
jgi:hypothetical protein